MNFWDKLENLRNKPEPARQTIALFAAILITAIIVALWLMFKTLGETFVPTDIEAPSPIQILWNYIKEILK